MFLNCGAGEDFWESFGLQEVKPVNPKGNQPWILIGKDFDPGQDWRQKEKGVAEDEMVGKHHQLDASEFEQTPGDTKGQRGLVCCSPWGLKELDMT